MASLNQDLLARPATDHSASNAHSGTSTNQDQPSTQNQTSTQTQSSNNFSGSKFPRAFIANLDPRLRPGHCGYPIFSRNPKPLPHLVNSSSPPPLPSLPLPSPFARLPTNPNFPRVAGTSAIPSLPLPSPFARLPTNLNFPRAAGTSAIPSLPPPSFGKPSLAAPDLITTAPTNPTFPNTARTSATRSSRTSSLSKPSLPTSSLFTLSPTTEAHTNPIFPQTARTSAPRSLSTAPRNPVFPQTARTSATRSLSTAPRNPVFPQTARTSATRSLSTAPRNPIFPETAGTSATYSSSGPSHFAPIQTFSVASAAPTDLIQAPLFTAPASSAESPLFSTPNLPAASTISPFPVADYSFTTPTFSTAPTSSTTHHLSSRFPLAPIAPPVPANSPYSTVPPTLAPRRQGQGPFEILTDADCANMAQQYDSAWLANRGYRVDDFEHHSKTKFQKLFREGALLQNDIFVFTVDTDSNGIKGSIKIRTAIHAVSTRGNPTIAIPTQDPLAPLALLPNITGIGQVVDWLVAHDATIVAANKHKYGRTKNIKVERNGVEVGDLYRMIKAYDIYNMEVDAWAARVGLPRRQRHP